MNKPSILQRVAAAIASVCTTSLLLTAVVSLSEPPQATGSTQLASATLPLLPATDTVRR